MKKTCLVCQSSSFTPIFSNTLLKCGDCGFIAANMEIDASVLKQIYTENYFKGEEYVDYIRDKSILQTNFKKRIQRIQRKLPHHAIHHAIEIGCAYGFFAEVFNQQYPHIQYAGYDVVPEAIDYGIQQLHQNLHCEDYLEVNIDKPISDVFMFDVIEHLPDPDQFIQKASSELSSGGMIYITTGDISRLLPKLQGPGWRMIHPPSHLHYFSKKTLSILLTNNGFEVVDISYPPVYRSIRLIYYSLFMLRKKYPKWIESIYTRIPEKMNIGLNTFDIMFVMAKKK